MTPLPSRAARAWLMASTGSRSPPPTFPGDADTTSSQRPRTAPNRRSHEVDAQSGEGLAVVEAKRGQAGSTAAQDWEDEGGAAF